MLEKLITNLKNSLPAPIREKLGIAEENQEDSEESKDFDDSDNDSEASSSEVSEEEQKKKRNSMMLRVVIILGLAYFAVDEFVLKTEENATEEIVGAKPKRKRPVKKAAEEVAATNAAVEDTQGAESSAQESSTETAPSETVTEAPSQTPPPIENINVLDKSETPDQKLDQLVSEVEPTPEPSFNETPAETSAVAPTETANEVSSQTASESPSQSSFGESSQSTSIATSSNDSMEIPTELPTEQITIPSQPKGQQNNSMASKIAEETTETPPPAYDQVGRGLVYNCKDKYWACLNKTAYVVCNKNMKWNKSKGSAAECVVQNIYSSDEDCAKVQKYNVSTSVPTAFCQN